ncbi:HNH domain-containing protein [Pleurotus pulmonarius]
MGDVQQFSIFKDCLARRILSRPDYTSESSDGDLDDFVTFLATESWSTLPQSIRELTYETKDSISEIDALALDSTPISFTDTLTAYGLSEDTESALLFLKRTIEAYVSDASAPPPVWSSTRTTECEVLKRKWHPQSMLNSVAWICRPCHNVVHSVARGEDLAQNYYTVELLLAREDIQKWRRYAAKQRYGVRRG